MEIGEDETIWKRWEEEKSYYPDAIRHFSKFRSTNEDKGMGFLTNQMMNTKFPRWSVNNLPISLQSIKLFLFFNFSIIKIFDL